MNPKCLHSLTIHIHNSQCPCKVKRLYFQIALEQYTEVSYKISTELMIRQRHKLIVGFELLFVSLRPNHAIVEDIRLGNSEQYGTEQLKELLKLLPEAEEVRTLATFTQFLELTTAFTYRCESRNFLLT